MTSKMLAAWLAFLAGLDFAAAAAWPTDVLPEPVMVTLQIVVGALNVATAVYAGKVALMPGDKTAALGREPYRPDHSAF